MKKYQLLAISLILISISAPGLAETFSYKGVKASYALITLDIDGIPKDMKGDGLRVALYAPVLPKVSVLASYQTASADLTYAGSTAKINSDVIGVGVLYHSPINVTTDYYAGITFLQYDEDLKINGSLFASEKSNGNSLYVGMRSMTANNIEINFEVDRTDVEGSTSTSFGFGADYYIDKLFSMGAAYSASDDQSQVVFIATKYF